MQIALVIIYNHQFNKNIERLEKLYEGRFSTIYHLVPFYEGQKENVISVYESSLYFQGYVAQGFKRFFKQEYQHYLFVADDMVINPTINETNYQKYFLLEKESCFIPRLSPLNQGGAFWVNYQKFIENYTPFTVGVEVQQQLPNYEEALKRLNHHGIADSCLQYKQMYAKPELESFKPSHFYDFIKQKYKYNKHKESFIKTNYPLVRSYSDIFVVSQEVIKKFCHYCGVFAATNLFVELAIPTALVLAAEKISTEQSLKLKGRALWTSEDFIFLDKYENNLEHLLAEFPSETLYLHPIKLSQWQ